MKQNLENAVLGSERSCFSFKANFSLSST